jgi:hypothetical protein
MTLLELCVRRVGFRRGARVGAFVVAWGVARRELGRRPTVEEYAAYWKQPRTSAFREQEWFREAFPECETPDPLLDLMEREGLGERLDPRRLSQPA